MAPIVVSKMKYRNVYRYGSTFPAGEELDVHPLAELIDMIRFRIKPTIII